MHILIHGLCNNKHPCSVVKTLCLKKNISFVYVRTILINIYDSANPIQRMLVYDIKIRHGFSMSFQMYY
jgi:hypothetical protein